MTYLMTALQILGMTNMKAQVSLIGYTYLGYLGGHFYYLSNCETTWEEARAAAIEMGGYLATIHDGESDWVGLWASLHAGVGWGDDLNGAWIGYHGVNGVYEWANGESGWGESWSYNGLGLYEPFYANGAALIGDQLTYEITGLYLWTTAPVTAEAEFIVEFPNQPNCDNPNKTYVCHNGNTICISNSAVQSHLNHGDLAGPCGPCNTYAMQAPVNDEPETEGQVFVPAKVKLSQSEEGVDFLQHSKQSNQIQTFPNPATDMIHVVFSPLNEKSDLYIRDQFGKIVWTGKIEKDQSKLRLNLYTSNFQSGSYVISMVSSDLILTKQFILIK